MPVLALANRFAVVALQTRTEAFIEAELSVDNCCVFLTAADRFSCARLRSSCFDFVVRHFEQVVASKGFCHLPFEMFRDLIASDSLFVRSEEIVYEAAATWIAGDRDIRSDCAAALLQLVRFPLIPTRFLYEVVEKDSRIANVDIVPRLLLEAYRFHAIVGAGLTPLISPNTVERGNEQIIFGDKAGQLSALSSSMSGNHPLANIRAHDDKYVYLGRSETVF